MPGIATVEGVATAGAASVFASSGSLFAMLGSIII
jgi:hypothetical protein